MGVDESKIQAPCLCPQFLAKRDERPERWVDVADGQQLWVIKEQIT
jgi:hypothetical protein